jgi:hypothetical protein
MKQSLSLLFDISHHNFATNFLVKRLSVQQEAGMTGKWLLRSACIVAAMLSLSGCIIVPEHHYRPAYYYR